MNIYVDEKKIIIPDNKKPIGDGTEGIVYRIGNKTYKIYYPQALTDEFGAKKKYHEYLMTMETKKIILPKESIYNEDGEYIGYTAPFVKGSRLNKSVITNLPKDSLIKNLQILERDIEILSNGYVIMSDVKPYNYMLDKRGKEISLIDPGRYKSFQYPSRELNKFFNIKQFEELIDRLIEEDFYIFKPIKTPRKQRELALFLKDKFKNSGLSISEFFDKILENDETILEYAKKQERYIK